MNVSTIRTAWLMLIKENPVAVSEGYEDDVARRYSWDDTVPKHREPGIGDLIVLWDSRYLLGVSVINSISTDVASKLRFRCPECGKTDVRKRKVTKPTYSCGKCQAKFNLPKEEQIEVKTYHASYGRSWIDLAGVIEGESLREMCHHPKSQHAIRSIDYSKFLRGLPFELQIPANKMLIAESTPINSGHVPRMQKSRVGQAAFRRRLLRKYGHVCALSGAAPDLVLDAAHLYSYAEKGIHDDAGGLLIRKDLHRLFDLGKIRVDPKTMLIWVDEKLFLYPIYRKLHGQNLSVTVPAKAMAWLKEHWEFHSQK